MNALQKLWRGQYSLPITYWGFGIVGGFVLSAPFRYVTPGSAAAILWAVAFSLYLIVVIVSIWRAATLYAGKQRWARLAKATTALSALLVAAFVSGIFVGLASYLKPTTPATTDSKPAKEPDWEKGVYAPPSQPK